MSDDFDDACCILAIRCNCYQVVVVVMMVVVVVVPGNLNPFKLPPLCPGHCQETTG